MNILRVFLLCFLVGLVPGFGAEEIRRIAILTSSGLEEPAAILTSAFSATPGIELVERDQLAAIVRERGIQVQNLGSAQISALGKVLGAQALLVLDRPSPGAAFSCRLIAVDSGLAIMESQSVWPMNDPAGWASHLSRQYASALRGVPRAPGTASLVVNLGVRSPTTGPDARKLERAVSFAIGRSLTGLSGVYVLDRAQMREATWEKQLSESAQRNFWSGTWLLDGNIQDTGGKLVYEGQLRPLAQGSGRPIKAEAASPGDIGIAVAAEVAGILGAEAATAAADASAESRLFQEQAEWAFRWKLYEEAERAADASWYLGNKTEAVGLIRSLSPARAAEGRLWAMGGSYDNSVPYVHGLETLARAFSNLRDTIRHAGSEPSPKFLADATEMFVIASKLLKQRYFKSSPPGAEEAAALKSLRGELRVLAPMMSEECQRAWIKMTPREQKNSRDPYRPPMSFFVEYLTHSPLWGDTPEQSVEQFEKALEAADALDPEVSRRVRRMAIFDRENNGPIMPIVVAWNAADRPRVSEVRNQLLEKMMRGSAERKLEACHLGLLRYYNFQDKKLLARVPDEVIENELRKLYDTLTTLRPQIVAGQVDTVTMCEVISLAGQVANVYERPALSAKAADLQKKLLLLLLQSGWAGEPGVYNPLFYKVSFSDAERDQYLAAIRAIPMTKGWFPDHYVESVIKQTNVDPSVRQTPPPIQPVANALAPAFRFPIADAAKTTSIESVIVCRGRYLVRVNDYRRFLRILEIDPATGGQKVVLDVPTHDPQYAALESSKAWTADEQNLYFLGNQTIYRVERATGKMAAKQISLLSPEDAVLRLVLDQLYVVQSGAFIRIDPASFEAELLASAKRRPARTILDDKEGLKGTPVELDGGMALVTDEYIHRWNPATRNFDSTPFRLRPKSRTPYDRDFVLRLQPQLAISYDDPGYWIVVDPNRSGVAPKITGYWPPTIIGGRQANTLMGLSAGGSVLYQLFWMREQGLQLMAYGPTANHCAPLGGLTTIEYGKVTGADDGVLVWGGGAKELLFYRYKDMEKYPP